LDCYLDGELEPSPVIEVEAHVHACSICREELVVVRQVKRAVRSLAEPTPELPAGLRERVVASLDAESRSGGIRGAAFTSGLVLAAAALLAVVATTGSPAPGPGVADLGLGWPGSSAQGTAPETAQVRPGSAPNAASSLLREVVARHTDQLPPDIAADRPEAVTNFLRGKIGFRVRAVEFDDASVRLLGARVSNVGEVPAARIDYGVGESRMTVVVFQPSAQLARLLRDDAELERTGGHRVRAGSNLVTYHNVHGYTVPVLERQGLAYAFTGDLDQGRMLELLATVRLP
jgi:anti-sigma factor RsiW